MGSCRDGYTEDAAMKRFMLLIALAALCLMPLIAGAEMIGDEMKVVRCEEYITLRGEPNTKAAELDRIPLGAKVVYLGEAENKFLHVAYENQTGYALKNYLRAQEAAPGTAAAVSRAARAEINAFLSGIAITGVTGFTGGNVSDQELVEMALWYMWYNKRSAFMGSDLPDYGHRLTDVLAKREVKRLFGREVEALEAQYQPHENGYFYMNEPGGPLGYGCANMSHAEWIDGDRLRVYFGLYGEGEGWNEAIFTAFPEQLALMYAGQPVHQGYAVINIGAGTLEDSSKWAIEAFVAELIGP